MILDKSLNFSCKITVLVLIFVEEAVKDTCIFLSHFFHLEIFISGTFVRQTVSNIASLMLLLCVLFFQPNGRTRHV
jgi:hypothetical protein